MKQCFTALAAAVWVHLWHDGAECGTGGGEWGIPLGNKRARLTAETQRRGERQCFDAECGSLGVRRKRTRGVCHGEDRMNAENQ